MYTCGEQKVWQQWLKWYNNPRVQNAKIQTHLYVTLNVLQYIIYFCWLKQINQTILQHLNFKCSFEDIIALDDNVLLLISSENLCNNNSGGH
jgi:hypothetical protein